MCTWCTLERIVKMTLGENIRIYRAKNKMTEVQLADKLNCSPSLISYIENDWIEKCTLKKYIEIIKLLQLTPEETYETLMNFDIQS